MRETAPQRGVGFRWGLAAGLIYAALSLLALPWAFSGSAGGPAPSALFWPAAFLAPAAVAWAGWVTNRRWRCAAGVGLGSLPLWIAHHWWVSDVSFAGVFPLIGYLAAWPALFVLVVSMARRSAPVLGPACIVPTVWVGLEFLRGELILGGYAWFLAGHPLIEFLPLARASAAGGVYLVSWLVVAPAGIALAARYGSRAGRRCAWAVSAIVLAAVGSGLVVVPGGGSGRTIVVGLVQTDVPQNNKLMPTPEQVTADFVDLLRLTRQAKESGAELIVLPETVFPGLALDAQGAQTASRAIGPDVNGFRDALLETQRDLGRAMLVGAITRDGLAIEETEQGARLTQSAVHNSAYLVWRGEVLPERYDKLRPTPFGETLPWVHGVSWLREFILRVGLGASGMDFGLDPGTRAVVLPVPTPSGEVRAATPICFESSMPGVVRRLARAGDGAELLVVMTNDGWFGRFDAGRAMHLLQARWRCVEAALPMVRSANTGVTAVIDRDGRVRAALPVRTAGTLVEPVAIGGGETVYTSHGDLVGWSCLALGTVLTAWGWRAGRGRRASSEGETDAHA
ncbi:MAG: apolipoprotein N-acyltransferase [Phycisphaerales bacterium]